MLLVNIADQFFVCFSDPRYPNYYVTLHADGKQKNPTYRHNKVGSYHKTKRKRGKKKAHRISYCFTQLSKLSTTYLHYQNK